MINVYILTFLHEANTDLGTCHFFGQFALASTGFNESTYLLQYIQCQCLYHTYL